MTGSTGYTGVTGSTGYTGVTGSTGYTGVTGSTGYTGVTGSTGYTGVTGSTGYTGVTGSTGYTGRTGSTGYTGVTGSTGYTGVTGSTGYTGVTGSTGYTGVTGSTGYTGVTGSTGYTGVTGSTGYTGVTGSTGYTGVTGSTGYTGVTGSTGYTGVTGSTGSFPSVTNYGASRIVVSDADPKLLNAYPNLTYASNILNAPVITAIEMRADAISTTYISTNIIYTNNIIVSSLTTTQGIHIDSLNPYTTTQDLQFVALYNSTSRELLYANQFAISSITNVNARFVVDPELQTSSLVVGINGDSVYLNGVSGDLMCSGGLYPAIDNSVDLGNGGHRWQNIYAASGTVNSSDIRLKKDVADISIGLEFIDQLRPVQYKFIEGKKEVHSNLHGSTIISSIAGKRTHYGLIAQEVHSTMKSDDPALWILDNAKDPESAQGLRYTEFIAPMIKAIQDLHSILQSTNKTLESHSAEIRFLKSQLYK